MKELLRLAALYERTEDWVEADIIAAKICSIIKKNEDRQSKLQELYGKAVEDNQLNVALGITDRIVG